ncbi:MAG TPA: DUF3999 family protein [Bryobacteraceae bacterium]|nr:DUF3999 family protein [Bryobacteraceae bacterium]
MKNKLVVVCVTLAAAGSAQAPGAPEPLTAWRYFKEIQSPRGPVLVDFLLDAETLDKARPDGADLRLYDSSGREVAYVLRVRRAVESSTDFQPRVFNKAVQGASAEISCDLGEEPQEHNEVDMDSAGSNFRRTAEVEGSADGDHWSTLARDAILFRFSAQDRTVEQKAIVYPVSRFRYLRVRIERDPQADRSAPEIQDIRVRRTMNMRAENASYPAALQSREPDRVDGRPASIWRIDLRARVPLDRLRLATEEIGFSRPFRLQNIDDPADPVEIASGDLARRDDASSPEPVIGFAETFAHHLKLIVTDDRNAPLRITNAGAAGAAREVMFEADAAVAPPLRLYYGNRRALAPHYDMAARMSPDQQRAPVRVMLGAERANPAYQPEAQPLSQRLPWLVYVVLAAATLALVYMLLKILREASEKFGRTATE